MVIGPWICHWVGFVFFFPPDKPVGCMIAVPSLGSGESEEQVIVILKDVPGCHKV